MWSSVLACVGGAFLSTMQTPTPDAPAGGPWHAWLDSPGGKLPFGLELERRDAGWRAFVTNSDERIELDARVAAAGERHELVIEFPHYDAVLRGTITDEGRALDGAWTALRPDRAARTLAFHARADAAPRFTSSHEPSEAADAHESANGRFDLTFADDPEAAVLVLRGTADRVHGTVLSAKGDYRYLEGVLDGDRLQLSTFDGTHAYLFDGRLAEGRFSGRFWSADGAPREWTATRAKPDSATPPRAATAVFDENFGLAWLRYPDLDGRMTSLADERFAGKARILQLAGSWCPNCHDETAYMAELDRKYRARGLSILALAFETGGGFEREARQVRRMLERHGAAYPALIAGAADKAFASQAFPALERIGAFPTTIFLSSDGRVRAVHTGFAGPATGDAHAALRKTFEGLIEELLSHQAPRIPSAQFALESDVWREIRDGVLVHPARDDAGVRSVEIWDLYRFGQPAPETARHIGSWDAVGDTLRMWDTWWQYDARARTFFDAADVARRMVPSARFTFPVVDDRAYGTIDALRASVTSSDAAVRRDGAYFIAAQLMQQRHGPPPEGDVLQADDARLLLPLVRDPDARVRATACWAAGVLQLVEAEEALIEALQHGFAPVRREAARALAWSSTSAAKTALEAVRADRDPEVRAAAEASLRATAK